MKNRFAFPVLFGVLSLFTTGVNAGRDLHINGDFRGAAAPGRPALGWTAAGSGDFRTLPGRKSGDFILEISAPADDSASAVSAFHPVTGNVLELDAELSGSGVGSIGYEGFDATCRKMLAADRRSVRLDAARYGVKHHFRLDDPDVRFVRIVLAAEPGSIARFGDVDAEFENAAAVPVPATIPAPALASDRSKAAASARPLVNDKLYFYTFLAPEEHFQTKLAVGADIEFELGEDVDGGVFWRISQYDPRMVRVKLKHDQYGVRPLRSDKAEIEIRGLAPGQSVVELTCGPKKVIVNVTVM